MKIKKIIKLIVALTFSIIITVINVIPNGEINAVYGAVKKSVTIVNRPYQLYTGDIYTFRAKSFGIDSEQLIWSSSNEKVATFHESTGTLLANHPGTTTITVKDKTSGTKTQLKVTIKNAAKPPKGSSKASYLSGLNLSNENGEFYKTTKEEYIDTTRFTLYIQKDVEIPVNFVQTLNNLMDIIETETGENFYSTYYQLDQYNQLLGTMGTYFETAEQLKKLVSSENKVVIFILNDKDAYSYSYGSSGCIINTFHTPLYTDAIASELINHFLFTLLPRNGGGLQSCLASGFVNYYKEKILATYSIFNTETDGYSKMSDLQMKINKDTIEKLLYTANAGDDSWKLGFRIVTYLMETYGEHAFQQFHRSIVPTNSHESAKKEELQTLKLQFSGNFLTEFSDWYLDNLTRFGDKDLTVYGDWMIDDGYLLKYYGSDPDIIVPDIVTDIQPFAFQYNDTLKTITIPDTVTSIGGGVFFGCKNLTEIKLPWGITNIYVNTFEGCTSLQEIVLPNTIEGIFSSAFANCKSLTSIEIPEGVSLIEGWAFTGCSKLSNVSLPSTLESIGPYTFYGCMITEIAIPESVTKIGESAFGDSTDLTIIGVEGSYAETYAKQNNYKFIAY